MKRIRFYIKPMKLENVAIANALQLAAPEPRQPFSALSK